MNEVAENVKLKTDQTDEQVSPTSEAWQMLKRPPALYVLLIFGGWWAFVAISGQQLFPIPRWDFTATGQLGDSFGILGAFMTSLAAIFTYQTLLDTRKQVRTAEQAAIIQEREADLSKEAAVIERARSDARDIERDKADRRRDSEQTYFRLLELRFKVLADLHVAQREADLIGTDAAAEIVRRIEAVSFYSDPDPNPDYGSKYNDVYKKNQNDLGHYFRFTYHIVKFAREEFGRGAYPYVRLLRAQLSNAEIVLIALNCAHGEGREKFLEWIERYSILHNIDPVDRAKFRLDDYFRPRAFDPDAKANEPPRGAVDLLTVLDS